MALNGVRQEHLYCCIQEMHNDGYAIAEICDILDLNRSSYYKWLHRSKSFREVENESLLHDIGLIYAAHNSTYGYRRIADEYNATHEKRYNLKRFYRLAHLVGLLAVIRRKRPAYQRSKPEVTAENILNRDFTAKNTNEKWCTDVTEMKYGSEGEKAYLSAILDLKGRDIVSFAIGKHNNNQLVFDTFDLAVKKYPDAHPLFHSDRGFQYTSQQFKARLDKQKMTQSMSRVGKCIDNGPMEGFWGILKCEMYYLNHFETYEDLVTAVEQFIHYYNTQRRQHRLDCQTPASYRSLLEAA
ncbi:MAG TPA: IS3 family transposase [Clostridiales bacterium]|nr:IS3 family transposase [Clostridiales bacterium]